MDVMNAGGAAAQVPQRAIAQAVAEQRIANGPAVAPAGPAVTQQAVVQIRRAERPEPQDTNRALMLQSQTLANARQEEIRLLSRLSNLRETIVETENRLREMQAGELPMAIN